MWKKRNRRIDHFFHTASSVVIKNLLERGVSDLVIGWNEGFKDSPKYRSGDGTLIHADVNGSYNILRKSKPLFEWCRGMVVMPVNLKFAY